MDLKKSFLKKYEKVEVLEYPNNTSEDPLVSVCVQTYRQKNYITKCLDSILMQNTKFDFEILVGEDDSDDGTREICIKYAENYPDRIKLFLHSRENNIKVYGIHTSRFNSRYNIFSARGKYIAYIEGDDHWTDPLKLQKQVDYLESHPECGMTYSDITLINEQDEVIENTSAYEKIRQRYKSGNIFWDLLLGNFINTVTVCGRKNLYLDYHTKFHDEEFAFDLRMYLHFSSLSKVKYFNQKMANYRVHGEGISRTKDFFSKRSPLVKQSALIHYLNLIKFDTSKIDVKKFSLTTYLIILNKNLTLKERLPIIKVLLTRPVLFKMVVIWYFSNVSIFKAVFR